MVCYFYCKHFHQRRLPAIHQWSLKDKESVIVNPDIIVHTLRKKGEIKTVSFLTRFHISLVPSLMQPEFAEWLE